ncbi:unnamed protein product [Timema podura]|uniref:Uncharacterized protein n=1 Tax=Timema podura TaxID=61482 RepID=A0ABN7PPV8_TIMPD|nr:unnamed protein product [Timema podura]
MHGIGLKKIQVPNRMGKINGFMSAKYHCLQLGRCLF